jgi:hypothetical protein
MPAKAPLGRRTVQEMRTTTATNPLMIEFMISFPLSKAFKIWLQTPDEMTNAPADMHQTPPFSSLMGRLPKNRKATKISSSLGNEDLRGLW